MSDTSEFGADEPPTMADAHSSASSRIDEIFGDGGRDEGDAPPAPWEEAGLDAAAMWDHNVNLVQHAQQFQPFADAFGAINPQDAEFVLGFVRAVGTGDRQQLSQYGRQLREALAQSDDFAADEFDPFDVNAVDQRVDQIVQQRLNGYGQHQAALQQEIGVQTAQTSLLLRARDLADQLGVPELADPNSPAALEMWRAALKDGDGDPLSRLERAAKAVAKRRKDANDERAGMRNARESALERISKIMKDKVS